MRQLIVILTLFVTCLCFGKDNAVLETGMKIKEY